MKNILMLRITTIFYDKVNLGTSMSMTSTKNIANIFLNIHKTLVSKRDETS